MAAWVAGNTFQRETQLLTAPTEFLLPLLLFVEGSFYRASHLRTYIPSKLNICIFSVLPRPFSPTYREIHEVLLGGPDCYEEVDGRFDYIPEARKAPDSFD